MSNVLKATNLSVGYEGKAVLKDLNFAIRKGDLICLMGGNGCGKTTLLKSLCGLLEPVSGEVLVGGDIISSINEMELAKKISIVLTDRPEAEHLSVMEVIRLGRFAYSNFWGGLGEEDEKIINETISLLGIESLKNKMFDELSDGQKQKVLIARAIVQDTPILFLDEPTTYLDIPHKMEVLKLLKKIAKEKEIAVFFSSHDWELILEMCDQVWPLTRDGELLMGAPEDMLLNRDIEKTFSHDDFKVDFNKGSFCEEKSFEFSISIEGQDERRVFWTKHFFEKSGYEIKKSSDHSIVVSSDHWTWNNSNFNSLFELMSALKQKS